MRNIVVAITGASGALYATRLIEVLAENDVHVHVAISSLGRRLLFDELGMRRADASSLAPARPELVTMYSDNDVGAKIASGSFLHDGMVVVPCSANTLGAIASGLGDNLVKRAAAVTLKERRKLVLAYRESPMSHIDILNMERLSSAGAIIAPLAPGFYLLPKSIDELVDFMVGRLLDLLDVKHTLSVRLKQEDESIERTME
jgi:polyprenyl P-hydroxybenzoate/phenylacrylic acid decarboxylase-like protein